MISTIAVVLFAGLPLADGPAEELARFQGGWRLVREHLNKKDMQGVETEWLIEGDKLTETYRRTDRGKITLDTTTKPARFEMTYASDPKFQRRGIYRFEGDKLIIHTTAVLPSFAPDPTEFTDKLNTRHWLDTWRRTEGPGGEVIDGKWELLERAQGDRKFKHNSQSMRIGGWRMDQ